MFSATGLAWQPGLKKIKVKLDLLAIIDDRKRYSGRNLSLYRYTKGNKKHMEDDHKNKELPYI